jgi:hypothetical protein
LLPVGFRFTAQLVAQVQKLEARDNVALRYFVKMDKPAKKSGAAPAPGARPSQPPLPANANRPQHA